MLADDIQAAIGGPRDVGGSLSWLAGEIAKAHRFDLSVDVARSVAAICALAMEQQLKALPLCRWPFPLTWLEWPGSASSTTVRRFGALITAEPGLQHGQITFVWEITVPEVCPWQIAFDWRPVLRAPVPTMGRRVTRAELAATQDPLIQRSDAKAILANEERYGFAEHPVMAELHRRMAGNRSAADTIWNVAITHLRGMPDFMRAAMLLINSKNLTAALPVSASQKLQRARTKRGAAPLLDHTQIQLKLSKALAARATNGQQKGVRMHLVRGHFKIRGTGVFWWSPFQRGSAAHGVIIRQDRHVVPSQAPGLATSTPTS